MAAGLSIFDRTGSDVLPDMNTYDEPGRGGYRWLTDESEAASGDNIVFADEGEWEDSYARED